MNKLWTRVQSSGGKDKGKKDKERNDLKVIIGENLVRLSQLEGLTLELYKESVLDRIIEIVSPYFIIPNKLGSFQGRQDLSTILDGLYHPGLP